MKCPKCRSLTARDENGVWDRCLNCGWYRRRKPDAEQGDQCPGCDNGADVNCDKCEWSPILAQPDAEQGE
jgi:hypothetical protein